MLLALTRAASHGEALTLLDPTVSPVLTHGCCPPGALGAGPDETRGGHGRAIGVLLRHILEALTQLTGRAGDPHVALGRK